MLSRVAESIYWMSRQMERAENVARFLEVTLHMMVDQPEYVVEPWQPLVLASGDKEYFHEHYSVADERNVVNFLAFDRDYHSSMLTSLGLARHNAKGVRDVMPTEAFEHLNEFYHFVSNSREQQANEPTSEFFDQVRNHAITWTGVCESTMTHDLAWHFLNVGRLLERADKTSRILDVKYFSLLPRVEDVGTAVDDLQWSTLLKAVSAFEAYRRKHHLMDIRKIVAFMLFHDTFPRSIRYCISGADWSLREIEKQTNSHAAGQAKRRVSSLRHRLDNTNVEEVLAGGMHEFIDRLQLELNEIGDQMAHEYFNVETAV